MLERNLRVMDASALALLRDHQLPIIVFDMSDGQAMQAAVRGEAIGTLIAGGDAVLAT